MKAADPHVARCGAKTKTGGRCQRSPMPNGRCYRHGGATPVGSALPQFKHGRYSVLAKEIKGLGAHYERALSDPNLLTLQDEIETLVEQVRQKVAAAVNVASADMIRLLSQAQHEAEKPLRTAQVQRVLEKIAAVEVRPPAKVHVPVTPARVAPPRPPAPRVPPSGGNGDLTRAAERKVLTVLAQYPQGRTMRQVATLAVYAINGGGFRNAVGRLRTLGYLEGSADRLLITDAGRAALGDWTPLPTGEALAQHWLSSLNRRAEREILEALLSAYPTALSAEDLAASTPTQYEASGGGFRNALGKLKTLELVVAERGLYCASEDLFSPR